MPEAVTDWLITQGPLGVAVFFLIAALMWAVKKWTDALEKNEQLQEERLQDQIKTAERDVQIARESAVLSNEMKNVMAANTSALQALLQRGSA